MPKEQRGGFPTFWRTYGEGAEPALLLHCSLAHSGAWRGVANGLSDVLSMVAPDMPGHGKSDDWHNQGDLHDQITAIARDCLGEGGHVIGHSFGATIALRLAIEAPDKVTTLTLIEPVLFAAAKDDTDRFQGYLNRAAIFADAMSRKDWADAARKFTSVWGDGRDWQSLTNNEQAALVSRMPFIEASEAILLDDTADLLGAGRLEHVTAPTLLIRGQNSDPVIEVVHRALAGRIPGAREAVVEGAAHMAPLSHPAQVSDLIKAHVIGAKARNSTE